MNVDQNAGASALFFLVRSEEGLELLREDSVLRGKINARGLNAVCKDEQLLGQSPVYVLVQSQRGRDLLNNDERLQKLVLAKTLHIKVPASGKSAADWLKETADGIELLRKLDPDCLREKPMLQNAASATAPGLFREQQRKDASNVKPKHKTYKTSSCNVM